MKKILIACCILFFQLHASAQSPYKVKNTIPAKATFFPLNDVRLLPGPFKHAMASINPIMV